LHDRATTLETVEGARMALAVGMLALGAIAMGASPIFVRLADVGPYASAFWRTSLALPFLFVWARAEGPLTLGRATPLPIPPAQGGREQAEFVARAEAKSPKHAALDRSVVLSGVFFAGDLIFWHLAILATTIANATFLATTTPIWVALGAGLVLAERIGARTIAGIALCLAGGAALVGQSYGFAPQRLMGDLFGVITAVFFGCYLLAIRAARLRIGAGQLAFYSTAISAACLFVVAVVMEPTMLPRSLGGVAVLIALALVSQVVGQGLMAVALGTLPATFSSLVIFVEAIAAAIFGWIIMSEALDLIQVAGGALILVGIFVARPRTAKTAEAIP
jgi:drug/metabolite transporter (DMT)-like permease